ncbi:CHASE2 domain-containing protein [Nostoc sphaeroides]|uniref:CHASE2 domain-containing protein n=1 Tax=Nostoc sphaeroides TaxID=446679 RepID=UPI0022654509|nr:CHASE2 domain-containing protein [Nostoc sphaeroides]
MLKILKKLLIQPVLISSAIVTVAIIGIEKLGVLEPLELRVYDQMLQMRADPGADPRLLIVAITEDDIKRWNWPLSGEILDRLLDKLEQDIPRANRSRYISRSPC